MGPVPVLWVSGAPGVGKSTAGWGLYSRLRALGALVGYVDVDQVGLFCPDPPGDPDRRRLQAANAIEVLTNFGRHGATRLIVSGVVDPRRGVDPYVRHAENLSVTLVRLRAEWGELRRRYLGRELGAGRLDELRVLATGLDRKSTVGWDVFAASCTRGVSAAYVDVDQLGFVFPAGATPQLKGENLRRLSRGYLAAGAQCLVVVVRDAPGFYEDYLEGHPVTSVHLDAAPSDLADRVARRAAGEGPRLAGDDLFRAPEARLTEITERAAGEAREFRRRAGPGHVVIDTSVEDRATVVERLLTTLEPSLQ